MPYINQLQDERDRLRAEIERLRQGMHSVKTYLMSDKFASCDPIERAVNPDDVILRINEVLWHSDRMMD